MKKMVVTAACALCGATLVLGQDFKAGGHMAYSAGGDVLKKNFGFGGHFTAGVNESLSLDAAATVFPEDSPLIDGWVTTAALTARVGKSVAEGTHLYLGGGPSVNLFQAPDLEPSIGYHGCAGAELRLGRGFEFLAEYRYSFVGVTETVGRDFRYAFGLVRLGITYAL